MVALLKTNVVQSIALPLTAPTKDLARAITALARVADRRSTMPILAMIAIGDDADGVTLTATDLNMTLTMRAPREWSAWSGPPVCVNAKALADLVKTLPGVETSLSPFGNGLRVTSGSVATTLNGVHGREFPKVPAVKDETRFAACDGPTLSGMLDRVLFSVCRDETRFHLNGVFLEGRGTVLRMVSTDGHRLTKLDESLWIGTDSPIPHKGIILPEPAARQLTKLLGKGACDVAFQEPFLFVKQGNWTLAAKLIDAQFPPYEQVIPQDNAKIATTERKSLIAALKRAVKMTSETRGVKLVFDSGKLTLVYDHPELGTASEVLGCDTSIEFEIGFNPRYLIEVLSEIECDHVTMAFSDLLAPGILRGKDDFVACSVRDARYVGVVMPMRID